MNYHWLVAPYKWEPLFPNDPYRDGSTRMLPTWWQLCFPLPGNCRSVWRRQSKPTGRPVTILWHRVYGLCGLRVHEQSSSENFYAMRSILQAGPADCCQYTADYWLKERHKTEYLPILALVCLMEVITLRKFPKLAVVKTMMYFRFVSNGRGYMSRRDVRRKMCPSCSSLCARPWALCWVALRICFKDILHRYMGG